MTTSVDQLLDAMWRPGLSSRTEVYAIVDCARDTRLYPAVDATYLDKSCLYAGHLPWELKMTAPYLVRLQRGDSFTRFLIERGWGHSWASFLRSEADLRELRRHLRNFLRVRDESGKRLIFRFYDPRVLRVYLPTCLPVELD